MCARRPGRERSAEASLTRAFPQHTCLGDLFEKLLLPPPEGTWGEPRLLLRLSLAA